MKRFTTQFVPMAIFGAGVLLVSGIREQYVMPPIKPMQTISSTFLGLPGKDMIVSDEERKIAGMTDYTLRSFGADSAPTFTVYVGYYDRQVQGQTIHSPKNCLPGAGWEVMSSENRPLPPMASVGQIPGSVNRVILSNKGTQALVYYWYQGRGRVEANEYRVKWDLLRDAALYGRTEEALVRVVVPIPAGAAVGVSNSAEVRGADELALKVVSELYPEVARVLPVFESRS